MKFCTFGNTDKGKVRLENEDRFLVHEGRKVCVVADGLGGPAWGQLGQQYDHYRTDEAIYGPRYPNLIDYDRLFNFINRKMHEEGRKIREVIGIGSTLTTVPLNGRKISIGHVEDCVVFLFRDRDYIRITNDHTMAAEIKARLEPGTGGVYTRVIPHMLSPVASGSREKSKSISTPRPSRKAIASSFAATTLPRPKPRRSFSTRSGGPKSQRFYLADHRNRQRTRWSGQLHRCGHLCRQIPMESNGFEPTSSTMSL